MSQARTSIGFGHGEVIEIARTLDETREILEDGLATRVFVVLHNVKTGEEIAINPQQVTVLQTLAPTRRER